MASYVIVRQVGERHSEAYRLFGLPSATNLLSPRGSMALPFVENALDELQPEPATKDEWLGTLRTSGLLVVPARA